jgi:DNA-binding MarR family transcriptional regulator
MRKKKTSVAPGRLRVLAEFRHQLRLFLHFSETAAQKRGLQPQQHQLLLQIAGVRHKSAATIGYAAERLGLCHNTVVELSNRCEAAGLVVRKQAGPDSDRRCVFLELSPVGREKLEALSIDHARELNELAPKLIQTLTTLRAVHRKPRKRAERRKRDSGI